MALKEKLSDEIKTAMRGGLRARLDALRYLLSLVQNAEKEKYAKQPGAALTDDEAVAALQKEAKRRKEALELFRKGGRADLVEKEESGLAVIYEYIPKELSAKEIAAIVDELKAKGSGDFNSLMRETMARARGRADGKTVGEIVRKALG